MLEEVIGVVLAVRGTFANALQVSEMCYYRSAVCASPLAAAVVRSLDLTVPKL